MGKQMQAPVVSVILPTYNREYMVDEAIQSVLDQTFEYFELIIVDDGSSDSTRHIVASYLDSRIRYIYQNNAGLAATRNNGIQHAQGKYIAFLDDDDLFLPNKLALQVSFLEQNTRIGWVSGGYYVTDLHNRVLAERQPWRNYPDLTSKTWLFACMTTPHAVLIRREWLMQVGGFDSQMHYGEDWDLWLRLAYAGCPMTWVEHPVCCYRMHKTNLTREGVKFKLGFLRMLEKFFQQPQLPTSLKAIEQTAFARMHLQGAVREYQAYQIDEAKVDVKHAFNIIPVYEENELQEFLFQLIVAWAGHPLTPDPYDYINLVFDNLPPISTNLRDRRRQVLARFSMSRFFQAYDNEDWSQVRQLFAKSIINDPSWLANRGVLSILGSAVFGPQFMRHLRSIYRHL